MPRRQGLLGTPAPTQLWTEVLVGNAWGWMPGVGPSPPDKETLSLGRRVSKGLDQMTSDLPSNS